MKRLASYFLQGVLYLVPISVTIYVIYKAFFFFDTLLDYFIPAHGPGLGILFLAGIITSVGFIGSTFIVRPIADYFNTIVEKTPIVKIIYFAISDLLSAFVDKKKRFGKPVLVRTNIQPEEYKLGFITQPDLASLGLEETFVAVYFPHSYALSGSLTVVSSENIRRIDDHSAAEVMKFIASAGVANLKNDGADKGGEGK